MADIKLFLSLFIFTMIFNILLGLYAVNSADFESIELPQDRDLTLLNFTSVLFDWISVIFDIAFITFTILPWWLNFIFIGLNIAMVGIIIDLIWIG